MNRDTWPLVRYSRPFKHTPTPQPPLTGRPHTSTFTRLHPSPTPRRSSPRATPIYPSNARRLGLASSTDVAGRRAPKDTRAGCRRRRVISDSRRARHGRDHRRGGGQVAGRGVAGRGDRQAQRGLPRLLPLRLHSAPPAPQVLVPPRPQRRLPRPLHLPRRLPVDPALTEGRRGGGEDRERGARADHVRRAPGPAADGAGQHRPRRAAGVGRGGRRHARRLRARVRRVPVVGPLPGVDRRGGGRRGPVLPGAPHAGLLPVRRRGRGGGVPAVQPLRAGGVEPRRVPAAGAPGGGAYGGPEGPARRRGRQGARGAAERVRAHDGPVPVRRGGGEGGGVVDVQGRRSAAGGEAPAARRIMQPRAAALGIRRHPRGVQRVGRPGGVGGGAASARGVRDGAALVGHVPVRRDRAGAEHPARGVHPRPGPPPRPHGVQARPARALRRRVDPAQDQAHPQPARGAGHLQRVQLQQVPAVAALRVRPPGVRGRRHPGAPQPGRPVLVPAAHRGGQRRPPLQLGGHGDRAVGVHVRRADPEPAHHPVVQRRRPGVPERGVRVVAPAAAPRQLPQELLGQHHRGAGAQGAAVPGGPGGGVVHPLPGDEALDVLPGLRLQLERGGPAGVRQRRGAQAVVAGVRPDGGGHEGAVQALGAEEGGDRLGQARRRGDRLRRPALEDQHHRSTEVGLIDN